MKPMIVDRRQTGENDGTAFEGFGAGRGAEQRRGIQRAALDRKKLVGSEPLPGEIARLGKCSHLVVARGKRSLSRQEAPFEEGGVAVVRTGFELRHVDAVLADERLDLSRA